MGKRLAVGTAVLLCVGGVGCFEAPPEVQARAAAAKAEGAELERALDDVEERLLGNQATVKLWKELAWRRQQVTPIVCENLAGHVEGMEKFIAKEKRKARRIRRARLAAEVSAAPARATRARRN